MLEFSKIDADLSIYKRHKVVLWGAGDRGRRFKRIFDNFGIPVVGIVDINPQKWGKVFWETKILSPDQFIGETQKDDSYLVQISCGFEDSITERLQTAEIAYITTTEFELRMHSLEKYVMIKKHPELKYLIYDQEKRKFSDRFRNLSIDSFSAGELANEDTLNIVFAAPKVGNTSFNDAGYSGSLPGHSISVLGGELIYYMRQKKINLACGVRDIISQMLSWCFQAMVYFWDIEEFWLGGGDIQSIFEHYVISKNIDKECFYSYFREMAGYDYSVSQFFETQIKKYFGIDVYDYPFHTEKGYTIIDAGNIRIMIYQLEKMDKLEKPLAEFFGFGNEFTLARHNVASQKWYHNSYLKAKKEIRFDRSFFNECYEGKCMRHFYSDKDIENFKQKWIGNVRD